MSNHQNLIKNKNIKKKKSIELVFNTIKNCKHEIKDINNKIGNLFIYIITIIIKLLI